MQSIYIRIGAVVVVADILGVKEFGLIQSYFNWQEIDKMTAWPLDNEYDYKLMIHNEFTNNYTFEITDAEK